MAVTSITVTGTGVAGGISYSGTYEPSGLSPAPVITIDALVDTTVVASEVADTVGGGSLSGTLLVGDGTYTLRAEAIGGTAAESDPVLVPNAGTGAITIRGPTVAASAGTTLPAGSASGGVTIAAPQLAGAAATTAPGAAATGGIVIAAPVFAGTAVTVAPIVGVQPPVAVAAREHICPPVLEAKDPADVLDYWFDWSDPMAGFGNDTIATTAWRAAPDVPSALGLGATAEAGALRGVFVSGGTAGTAYRLTCTITTTLGRTLERSAIIYVEER